MIDDEIANAKGGRPCGITVKVNNLVDRGVINRLYSASQAGVPVRMIVRGMCSLVPGIEGRITSYNVCYTKLLRS